MWTAARLFDRRAPDPGWMLAGPCLLLVASVSGVIDSVDTQIGMSSAIFAAYTFAAAYEYWRGRTESLISRWPAIMLLLITGVGFLSWVSLTIFMPVSASRGGTIYSSEWFPLVVLITVIGRVALAFIVLAMAKERLELKQRLDAATDALTGLPNRRAFFRRAARRLRAQAESPATAAVLLFDLDHFKLINDQYGHAIGDQTLQLFAQTLSAAVRADGVIGRVGGEEFATLLPNTDLSTAVAIAERVRETFSEAASVISGVPVRGTVSVGATAGMVSDSSLDVLLGRADMALYAAKKSGRNRVMTLDSLDGDARASLPPKRISRLGALSIVPANADSEEEREAVN